MDDAMELDNAQGSRLKAPGKSAQGPRLKAEGSNLEPSTLNLERFSIRGQASLEMTVALFGGLLLLLGSFKIFLWASERIIRRQQYYDCTRSAAGGATPGVWSDPASAIQLHIFEDQPVSPNPC